MTVPFPEPTAARESRAGVLLGYLDYFRATVAAKLADLPAPEWHTSRLPSGWTPAQLVHHLTHVERRWLVWGFEGRPVEAPWGDSRDGRWYVPDDVAPAELLAALAAQGEHTRAVVARHDLAEVGAPGPRWDGAPPATLERVLLHLVQEHARHAGHLDVVRELVDGTVGE